MGMNVTLSIPYRCLVPEKRPEEGIRVPGNGVTDGCGLPRGSWELDLGPLGGQCTTGWLAT